MTLNVLTAAVLALLFVAAPAAAAEDPQNESESDPARPDDAAWVEECPPDMMCAAGTEGDGDAEPNRGGPDCEYCRNHQENDCLDCLETPMPADNTTWGTDCPPGVYCMVNGETDDPDDAGWVDCDGEICAYDEQEGPAAAEAAAAPVVALLLVAALAGLALVRAHRR